MAPGVAGGRKPVPFFFFPFQYQYAKKRYDKVRVSYDSALAALRNLESKATVREIVSALEAAAAPVASVATATPANGVGTRGKCSREFSKLYSGIQERGQRTCP